MPWWTIFLLLGVSFALWMTVGGIRFTGERRKRKKSVLETGPPSSSAADVAVLIPAHNEEASIAAALDSVLRIVPGGNVHVVADGCDDRTAGIARAYGVHVLEQWPGRGKAGGIQVCVEHFEIATRFDLLLILDADTRLDEDYLSRGLRMMDDPEMVALAGYAHTEWLPATLNPVGRVLLSYRTRLYAVMQWIKYGQTWRHTNVTPIVPGFASMYRTRVLPRIDLNPPGLVIEDFNMTFELHHRKLGKVAFQPSVFGITQDPDNLPDYYRQISRWWLGLWQTIRRHGLWWSWFSAALVLFLFETIIASLVMLVVATSVVFLAMDPVTGGLAMQWDWYASVHAWLTPILTPLNLLLFVFLPDYVLTCAVAVWLRRPSILVYGLGFLLVRCIDAIVTMRTLVQMWRIRSTGQWTSPTRRVVEAARPDDETGLADATTSPAAGIALPKTAPERLHENRPHPPSFWQRSPVLIDALHVATLLVFAAALIVVSVPVTVIVLGVVALLALGVCFDIVLCKRRDALRAQQRLPRSADGEG